MFDLESAKDYCSNELIRSMPDAYDIIRKAIQEGNRSVQVSIGKCHGGHNCECVGVITEIQLDKLILQKYKVVAVKVTPMFGIEVRPHYVISGWSVTKYPRMKVAKNVG